MSDAADLPKTMVRSLLDLDAALQRRPSMDFPEFEALVEKDPNQAALEDIIRRVEGWAPAESVRMLLALMVVHLSRFSPGYEELRPLFEASGRLLDQRAQKVV
jgi:hypothetical protein